MTRLLSMIVLVLALLCPKSSAQSRFNLDTGWVPSVDYTNTSADFSADAFAITACSDSTCTVTTVAPVLQYHYRVTLRNTTDQWHTTSGSWLTYFWLFNAPGQPAGNCLEAQGCGVPEMFALLAPNDGLPGGPDEVTFDEVRTFSPTDGVTTWVLPASAFAPNVRVPGSLPAHRLVVRPTHWWNLTVDGQAMPSGSHWPVSVTVEVSEARMRAVVCSQ